MAAAQQSLGFGKPSSVAHFERRLAEQVPKSTMEMVGRVSGQFGEFTSRHRFQCMVDDEPLRLLDRENLAHLAIIR